MTKASTPLTIEDVPSFFPDGADRALHIAGVVKLAEKIESIVKTFDGQLRLAALYHDIGYATPWKQTGFHPVDGALAARKHNLDEKVIQAVLHHSGSWLEARRLYPHLCMHYGEQCVMMDSALNRALCFCDLHTGAQGQQVTLDQRISDIRQRHAANIPLLEVMDVYYPQFQKIDAEWHTVLSAAA